MFSRVVTALTAVAVASTSCGANPGEAELSVAQGPGRVRLEAVRAHSAQFDEDDPGRAAGSQGEGIAATYILGHLQRAGYEVYLQPVPVSNLVNSTNVVALPSGGPDVRAVVVVPYDTAPGTSDTSPALGLFLEVARALEARDEGGGVEFAALGAERAEVSGGRLGSRRLAQYMRDRDQDPVVVSLEDIALDRDPRAAVARGEARRELVRIARAYGAPLRAKASITPTIEVFQAAGFRSVALSGPAEIAGEVLLEYLAEGVP